MSKSLKRVRAALAAAGAAHELRETGTARTAMQAAQELGCEVDQIAKSIVFEGERTGALCLFITPGAHRVAMPRAAGLAGEPLCRPVPAQIRAITGFAIGGVSPIGHLTPIRAFMDPYLMRFDRVWAAAGTPHHVFGTAPDTLARLSGALPAQFID